MYFGAHGFHKESIHQRFRHALLAEPYLAPPELHRERWRSAAFAVKRFSDNKCSKNAACDDWHMLTILNNPKLRSLVVYPLWKGLHDWKRTLGSWEDHRMFEAREVYRLITKWVDFGVWDDVRVAEAAGQVEVVFLCRSGGWTPPWHDRAFREFAFAGAKMSGRLADTPFIDKEDIDPLVPRKLDWAVIQSAPFQDAQILTQLQAELEGRRPLSLLA